MSAKHPMQPIIVDSDGVHRFKVNPIVRFLLDAGPYDMNKLAMMPFDIEDREQFAQLIGYSVSGFGELSYVSNRAYALAEEKSEALAMAKCKPTPVARLTAIGKGRGRKSR